MKKNILIKSFTQGKYDKVYGSSNLLDYRGEKVGKIAKHPKIKAVKDIKINKKSKNKMENIPINGIANIIEKAGEKFSRENLGVGKSSPEEYIEQVSRLTGLPRYDVKKSIKMVEEILSNIRESLKAQSPDGDLDVYDTNLYEVAGDKKIGWIPKGRNLGVIAPSNHPAVLALAVIGYGTKYPLTIKPSSREPFTSSRIIDALVKSGAPKGTVQMIIGNRNHGITEKIVENSDYSILFGGPQLESKYKNIKNTKVFGPGNSKVFVDREYVEKDEIYENIEESMMRDGGRGCINISQIVTNGDGEKVAKKLAERVYDLPVKDIMNPNARIPAAPGHVGEKKDPKKNLKKFEKMIDKYSNYSVRDITSEIKKGGRSISEEIRGALYMKPTVVMIDYNKKGKNHPLYREFPFQYVSVVEVEDKQIYEALSNSLTVSMFTNDNKKIEKVFKDPSIHKEYLGETTRNIDSREPHEIFIADFLYKKKGVHTKKL